MGEHTDYLGGGSDVSSGDDLTNYTDLYKLVKDSDSGSLLGNINWTKVLSSTASTAGEGLAKFWESYTKNKSEKSQLEYLKDKAEKELMADLVKSLVTSQRKESSSSKSVRSDFGPTAGLPSLGSAGSVSPNYPYPKSSGFNPKLAMKIASLLGRS